MPGQQRLFPNEQLSLLRNAILPHQTREMTMDWQVVVGLSLVALVTFAILVFKMIQCKRNPPMSVAKAPQDEAVAIAAVIATIG